MDLETVVQDDILVVKSPVSRIEYGNVNEFKNSMLDMIESGHAKICLDMENVEFMDSRGLSMLLSMVRLVGKEGGLCICNVQNPIKKMLAVTNTDKIVRITDSVREGVSLLAGTSS